ncbi:multicopper oxidase family protein [Nonomuraea sp. NPDC050153]|uniref:multicopper oxidase family protein n=1 Tax=Nonomuraea sp. NPDC050153 TaxID=3364359 RepID=UPI0037B36054
MLSRRGLLTLGAAALVLPAGLSACSGGGGGGSLIGSGGANNSEEGSGGALLNSEAPLPDPFTVALPVPPVLQPVREDAGTDYYEITQKAAKVEILPGLRTEIWGYEGLFPGPTVVSRRGRRTVVTHRNELPVPVSVHLHGGRTAPEHDGYPTDVIPARGGAVGGGREYVYAMEQRAATLWYHNHRMDYTGPQVYRSWQWHLSCQGRLPDRRRARLLGSSG